MTRIIAGDLGGRRLDAPRGLSTRPTADRVRQTLFDILAPRMNGCRFLDLCAGTGAIGLEAVSRGARHVVLVEQAARAVAVMRRNARALDVLARLEIMEEDAVRAVRRLGQCRSSFDVIYLDPPYESDLYETILTAIDSLALLAPEGWLVAEHFHKRLLADTFGALTRTREERIGDHRLSFYALV